MIVQCWRRAFLLLLFASILCSLSICDTVCDFNNDIIDRDAVHACCRKMSPEMGLGANQHCTLSNVRWNNTAKRGQLPGVVDFFFNGSMKIINTDFETRIPKLAECPQWKPERMCGFKRANQSEVESLLGRMVSNMWDKGMNKVTDYNNDSFYFFEYDVSAVDAGFPLGVFTENGREFWMPVNAVRMIAAGDIALVNCTVRSLYIRTMSWAGSVALTEGSSLNTSSTIRAHSSFKNTDQQGHGAGGSSAQTGDPNRGAPATSYIHLGDPYFDWSDVENKREGVAALTNIFLAYSRFIVPSVPGKGSRNDLGRGGGVIHLFSANNRVRICPSCSIVADGDGRGGGGSIYVWGSDMIELEDDGSSQSVISANGGSGDLPGGGGVIRLEGLKTWDDCAGRCSVGFYYSTLKENERVLEHQASPGWLWVSRHTDHRRRLVINGLALNSGSKNNVIPRGPMFPSCFLPMIFDGETEKIARNWLVLVNLVVHDVIVTDFVTYLPIYVRLLPESLLLTAHNLYPYAFSGDVYFGGVGGMESAPELLFQKSNKNLVVFPNNQTYEMCLKGTLTDSHSMVMCRWITGLYLQSPGAMRFDANTRIRAYRDVVFEYVDPAGVASANVTDRVRYNCDYTNCSFVFSGLLRFGGLTNYIRDDNLDSNKVNVALSSSLVVAYPYIVVTGNEYEKVNLHYKFKNDLDLQTVDASAVPDPSYVVERACNGTFECRTTGPPLDLAYTLDHRGMWNQPPLYNDMNGNFWEPHPNDTGMGSMLRFFLRHSADDSFDVVSTSVFLLGRHVVIDSVRIGAYSHIPQFDEALWFALSYEECLDRYSDSFGKERCGCLKTDATKFCRDIAKYDKTTLNVTLPIEDRYSPYSKYRSQIVVRGFLSARVFSDSNVRKPEGGDAALSAGIVSFQGAMKGVDSYFTLIAGSIQGGSFGGGGVGGGCRNGSATMCEGMVGTNSDGHAYGSFDGCGADVNPLTASSGDHLVDAMSFVDRQRQSNFTVLVLDNTPRGGIFAGVFKSSEKLTELPTHRFIAPSVAICANSMFQRMMIITAHGMGCSRGRSPADASKAGCYCLSRSSNGVAKPAGSGGGGAGGNGNTLVLLSNERQLSNASVVGVWGSNIRHDNEAVLTPGAGGGCSVPTCSKLQEVLGLKGYGSPRRFQDVCLICNAKQGCKTGYTGAMSYIDRSWGCFALGSRRERPECTGGGYIHIYAPIRYILANTDILRRERRNELQVQSISTQRLTVTREGETAAIPFLVSLSVFGKAGSRCSCLGGCERRKTSEITSQDVLHAAGGGGGGGTIRIDTGMTYYLLHDDFQSLPVNRQHRSPVFGLSGGGPEAATLLTEYGPAGGAGRLLLEWHNASCACEVNTTTPLNLCAGDGQRPCSIPKVSIGGDAAGARGTFRRPATVFVNKNTSTWLLDGMKCTKDRNDSSQKPKFGDTMPTMYMGEWWVSLALRKFFFGQIRDTKGSSQKTVAVVSDNESIRTKPLCPPGFSGVACQECTAQKDYPPFHSSVWGADTCDTCSDAESLAFDAPLLHCPCGEGKYLRATWNEGRKTQLQWDRQLMPTGVPSFDISWSSITYQSAVCQVAEKLTAFSQGATILDSRGTAVNEESIRDLLSLFRRVDAVAATHCRGRTDFGDCITAKRMDEFKELFVNDICNGERNSGCNGRALFESCAEGRGDVVGNALLCTTAPFHDILTPNHFVNGMLRNKQSVGVKMECHDCPVGATCWGIDSPICGLPFPNARYSPSPARTDMFYKCPNEDWCLSGGRCVDHRDDFLCTQCAIGYFDIYDECLPCSFGEVLFWISLLFILGLLLLLLARSYYLVSSMIFFESQLSELPLEAQHIWLLHDQSLQMERIISMNVQRAKSQILEHLDDAFTDRDRPALTSTLKTAERMILETMGKLSLSFKSRSQVVRTFLRHVRDDYDRKVKEAARMYASCRFSMDVDDSSDEEYLSHEDEKYVEQNGYVPPNLVLSGGSDEKVRTHTLDEEADAKSDLEAADDGQKEADDGKQELKPRIKVRYQDILSRVTEIGSHLFLHHNRISFVVPIMMMVNFFQILNLFSVVHWNRGFVLRKIVYFLSLPFSVLPQGLRCRFESGEQRVYDTLEQSLFHEYEVANYYGLAALRITAPISLLFALLGILFALGCVRSSVQVLGSNPRWYSPCLRWVCGWNCCGKTRDFSEVFMIIAILRVVFLYIFIAYIPLLYECMIIVFGCVDLPADMGSSEDGGQRIHDGVERLSVFPFYECGKSRDTFLPLIRVMLIFYLVVFPFAVLMAFKFRDRSGTAISSVLLKEYGLTVKRWLQFGPFEASHFVRVQSDGPDVAIEHAGELSNDDVSLSETPALRVRKGTTVDLHNANDLFGNGNPDYANDLFGDGNSPNANGALGDGNPPYANRALGDDDVANTTPRKGKEEALGTLDCCMSLLVDTWHRRGLGWYVFSWSVLGTKSPFKWMFYWLVAKILLVTCMVLPVHDVLQSLVGCFVLLILLQVLWKNPYRHRLYNMLERRLVVMNMVFILLFACEFFNENEKPSPDTSAVVVSRWSVSMVRYILYIGLGLCIFLVFVYWIRAFLMDTENELQRRFCRGRARCCACCFDCCCGRVFNCFTMVCGFLCCSHRPVTDAVVVLDNKSRTLHRIQRETASCCSSNGFKGFVMRSVRFVLGCDFDDIQEMER